MTPSHLKSKLSMSKSQIKRINGNCHEFQQHEALCNERYKQQQHRKSVQRGT